MDVLELANLVNQFATQYNLTLSKGNLKHDLIHASCRLGVSLADEMLVFCLQREQLASEKKANMIAEQLCKFNRVVNDFDYSLLVERYAEYNITHLTDKLVEEVASIINVH